MFRTLGEIIAYRPWRIVIVWLAITLAGTLWAFNVEKPPPDEMGSFLPKSDPFTVAFDKLGEAFPSAASRSMIAIVACRSPRITADDIAWLDQVTQESRKSRESQIIRGTLSPAVPFLRARLVSRDEQAAMAVLNLSTTMVSAATTELVNEVETNIARHAPPQGLTVELTGSAPIGRDFAAATATALHHTTWVTILSVLVILALVYRSPIGALVPLISIGLSVYLTFIALAALVKIKGLHWEVSTIERIFAVVLIFGAGVDYALFWIARYREKLRNDRDQPDYPAAAQDATRHAGHAVLFSALTTALGMCSLMAAELGPSRSAGKVLVLSVAMAAAAGLTLVPAIARLLGGALFWPVGPAAPPTFAQRVLWPKLADLIVRSPGGVLLAGLSIMVVPAAWALQMQPQFDSLMQLPKGTTSQRGFDITEAHFAHGQIYSTILLFTFDKKPGSPERMREISENLRKRMMKIKGVEDIYSLDSPIGKNEQFRDAVGIGRLLTPVAQGLESMSRDLYLSPTMPALRFEILINDPPFSLQAMHVVDELRAIAHERRQRFADADIRADLHLSGLTPYIMAVRDVAGSDQRRVMLLATLLIALIVMFIVHDGALTVFMVFSTLLNYGATLKLSELFFVHVMGLHGLDWKVRLIVFVIVVAVGQDYNIFLVSRLIEERKKAEYGEAVRRAVISTGSVISSCGIIMAATLGSLWVGGLTLLQQVGFSLALGILLDTYFVRPILIPSFFLVTRKRRKRANQDSVEDDLTLSPGVAEPPRER